MKTRSKAPVSVPTKKTVTNPTEKSGPINQHKMMAMGCAIPGAGSAGKLGK